MPGKQRLVRDLGERELIRRFGRLVTPCPDALLTGMEDAVAVGVGADALVVNTDMMVSSTDVLPGMTPTEIAWKTGVMGLSDLAAKGATARGVAVSLGLPADMKESYVMELVAGLDRVCREHSTYYLGGDTGECSELVINCTAFGLVRQEHLIRRKGAHPGDLVAVTGEFGYTGALFQAVLHAKDKAKGLLKDIRSKALQTRARLREGQELARGSLVSAGIDSSDGLAWSLHELATESRVGFRVDELPIPGICHKFAEANGLDAYDLALYGGEEFELVITTPANRFSSAVQAVQRVGGQLFRIGQVTEEEELVLTAERQERVIEPRGYEHFSLD
jgi:thiamine-monophosphate kinase